MNSIIRALQSDSRRRE